MNRVIKFRTFAMGKMFYWGFVVGGDESHFSGPVSGSGVLPHKSPQMQFTGLHDVNGVEIYESDLVTVPGVGVAEIKICQCYGVVYKANGAYGTCEVPYIDCAAENDYPTVIGNIYQNPELLEGVK